MRSSLLFMMGVALLPTPGRAQSLFGSQGLGIPMDPLDARARVLGPAGVGLLGPSLHPADIASAARIYLPTGQMTLQPQWVNGDLGGQNLNTQGTRFTQLGLAYPISSLGGTAVFHIRSFLDQRWEVEESSVQEFEGESVSVKDLFRSDGGVSTVQFGWAQRLGETFSLGIGVGSRIGSVSKTFRRTIGDGTSFDIVPYVTSGVWRYSGLTSTLGFQWDPVAVVRLGGAVTVSQDLKAKPTGSTEGAPKVFSIPTEYRLGASGILTPRLAVSAGITYADWKPSADGLDSGLVSGSIMGVGGGLEWAGLVWGGRNLPFRVGFKRSDLPFTFDGETPTETSFTGGLGLNMVPAQTGLIGTIDMAFERGKREAGSLSETFWRVAVTFRVGSF